MSESEARTITGSSGLPWAAGGKKLWQDWSGQMKSEGKDPSQHTGAFVTFVRNHITKSSEAASKAACSDEEEDVLPQDDIGSSSVDRALEYGDSLSQDDDDEEDFITGGIPAGTSLSDEISQVSKADLAKKTRQSSGLMELARVLRSSEEEEEEEEEKDPLEISATPTSPSPSSTPSSLFEEGGSSTARTSSKESVSEDLFQPPSRRSHLQRSRKKQMEDIDTAHKTTSILSSAAMSAVDNNSKHPASMFQFLSTRKGQREVLSHLDSCCMKTSHADFEKCTKQGGFDCDMAKGCPHFSAIGSEDEYEDMTQLHSLLRQATDDDGISSVIGKAATQHLIQIASIAYSMYKFNGRGRTDEAIAPIRFSVSDDMDVSALSEDDLDAITQNYTAVRAKAFATWASKALKNPPSHLLTSSRKLVNTLIEWLNSGDGAKYEGDVYIGYQSIVAYLIAMTASLHRHYRAAKEISGGASDALAALDFIDRSMQSGSVETSPGTFLDFDVVGSVPVKRGKKGKLKRFVRRGFKKITRIVTSSERKALQAMAKAGHNEYDLLLQSYRANNRTGTVPLATKYEKAREVMDDYVTRKAMENSRGLFNTIRGASMGSGTYDIFAMTLRVMATTAAVLLTSSARSYAAPSDERVRGNLNAFLNQTKERVRLDARRSIGNKDLDVTQPSTLKYKYDLSASKVMISVTPSHKLQPSDKKLTSPERTFVKTALGKAVRYANVHAANDHFMTIVIPEPRKMRNPTQQDMSNFHSHFNVMRDVTVACSNSARAVSHWKTLPSSEGDTFEHMFFHKTGRLQRKNTSPQGRMLRYKTHDGRDSKARVRRTKTAVYLSEEFQPTDTISETIINNIGLPENLTITFRRSLG